METRTIPGTDLALSTIGFGAWAIGGLWWGDDVVDATSIEAVHAALDAGINWFDTAPLYGHGHADEVLVEALGERRHEVIIATKVGVRWDGEGAHAQSDLSPAYLREDTEASLRRLGLEQIPLLQVHWPCERGTPLEESLDALVALQRDGLIAHFGLCNYPPDQLALAARHAPVATLQTPFSMLRREFEHGLQEVCLGAGGGPAMGVLAYEPLCRGLLTGKFAGDAPPTFPDSDLRARDDRFKGRAFQRASRLVEALSRVATHFETSPGALALAWLLRRPGVSSVIAGAKRAEQVRENAAAAALVDRDDLPWEIIDKMVDTTRL